MRLPVRSGPLPPQRPRPLHRPRSPSPRNRRPRRSPRRQGLWDGHHAELNDQGRSLSWPAPQHRPGRPGRRAVDHHRGRPLRHHPAPTRRLLTPRATGRNVHHQRAYSPEQTAQAFRAHATGVHADEAAVSLLIDRGTWLRRAEFEHITLEPALTDPIITRGWGELGRPQRRPPCRAQQRGVSCFESPGNSPVTTPAGHCATCIAGSTEPTRCWSCAPAVGAAPPATSPPSPDARGTRCQAALGPGLR